MKLSDLRTDGLATRFWSKVEWTPTCWLWKGAKASHGYGAYGFRLKDGSRKSTGAHRIAYLMIYGEIPDGLCVLHHCDNPACVNPSPDHLFLGTNRDNTKDAVTKGRMKGRDPALVGERHPLAKLNWERVEIIRSLWEREMLTQQELARCFGVGRTTILYVVHYKTWIRPSNSYSETHSDNMGEVRRHIRAVLPNQAGEYNPRAKLTWELVREIRKRYAMGGISQEGLGRQYGVSRREIGSIVNKLRWIE